jgi:hypothetical protein
MTLPKKNPFGSCGNATPTTVSSAGDMVFSSKRLPVVSEAANMHSREPPEEKQTMNNY